jgi:hypothetical protein
VTDHTGSVDPDRFSQLLRHRRPPMSVEVAIICDSCGRVIDGAKTAARARAAIKQQGGRVNLPGGKDECHWCVASRTGNRDR